MTEDGFVTDFASGRRYWAALVFLPILTAIVANYFLKSDYVAEAQVSSPPIIVEHYSAALHYIDVSELDVIRTQPTSIAAYGPTRSSATDALRLAIQSLQDAARKDVIDAHKRIEKEIGVLSQLVSALGSDKSFAAIDAVKSATDQIQRAKDDAERVSLWADSMIIRDVEVYDRALAESRFSIAVVVSVVLTFFLMLWVGARRNEQRRFPEDVAQY